MSRTITIRPAIVLRFDHGELVDHKPVIRRRVHEVHQVDPITGNRAICSAILDLDTIPQDLLWFHQSTNQIFRHIFIHTVVEPAASRIDTKFRQHFLRHVYHLRNHQLHFDLIRKLSAPDLRHKVLAAVASRLPQSQQPADFVVMQQAVVTGLDFQRPRFVRTEEFFSTQPR